MEACLIVKLGVSNIHRHNDRAGMTCSTITLKQELASPVHRGILVYVNRADNDKKLCSKFSNDREKPCPW
jgi:hypothetical protein